jgi:type II secretion system (T2SS) protein E
VIDVVVPPEEAAGGAALLRSVRDAARPGERAEEVLFDLGLASDVDYALELAAVTGIPFVGLRGFEPDEHLFLYVPVHVATRTRVCPLVLVGNSLKLASVFVDPDLSYLDEHFPNLHVELTIAPRSEILEALRRIAPGG